MPKRDIKRLPPRLELKCEWTACSQEPFDDVCLFLNHIRVHAESHLSQEKQLESEDGLLSCPWNGCGGSAFGSPQEFRLHISYHGFHSKLMALGSDALRNLNTRFEKPLECRNDSSSRTVLPELPDHFLCCWIACDKEFEEAESFYKHVATHAMEDVQIPSLSKEILKKTRFALCRWINCETQSLTRSHLKTHLKTHTQEKSVACPTCGAMFFDKQKYLDHVMRQFKLEGNESDDSDSNDDDGPQKIHRHLCSKCSEEFLTRRLLREHLRRHSSRISCDICRYECDTQSNLKRHMAYRHSDDRPFECQFCSAKFKSRSDLRSHIYIHNEENPFKCVLCDFEARCGQTLSVHHKTVHQNTVRKYECSFCCKQYTRGYGLTQHLMKSHAMRLPETKSKFSYAPNADGVFRLVS